MEEAGWRHYLRLVLNIVIPLTGWILLCFLGPKIIKFFMPFVIGWIIAMIANPLVRLLERRMRLVRKHSSIVIVVAALALVIGLLYLLISRSFALLYGFIKDLPVLYAGIEGDVSRSMEQIDHLFQFLPDSIQQTWSEIGNNLGIYLGKVVEGIASPTVEAAGTVARSIPAVLVYMVVTILSAYFFIVDRDNILAFVKAHTPAWSQRYTSYLKGEVRRLVGGYFMAQFKIMAVVWLILTVGFLVLGVGYGPLWAFLIAFLDFLPVFGTGTALIPWGLIKLLGGEYAFAAGLLLGIINVLFITVLQQLTPDFLVGRVMGIQFLCSAGLQPVSYMLTGVVLNQFSISQLYLISGGSIILITIVILVYSYKSNTM